MFASCPLQKQPVARLPCCFRRQAPFARTTVCIALAILWISYATCCFLYAFHALHTPFFQFCVTFFEKQLPAFVGKHDFENCIKTKSCTEELPRPPVRTDYTYFGPLYRTWNLQNRWEKRIFIVYAPSLDALFAIWCSTACILHDIFPFSQCFRHHFAENGPCSRKSHRANM